MQAQERQRAHGDVDRVVVMAASAGGVEALSEVVAGLPVDLRAAVIAVLHMPHDANSRLPEILERAGPLPVATAEDGAPIEFGRIVVAPPNWHVIVAAGRVWLIDGARENGVRPSADPLFRSAARAYGNRAIGVVLSGTLDDGAAGMAAIAAVGGTTVVQDPYDASAPGMPRAAMENVRVDFIVPARGIGSLIGRLVTDDPIRPTSSAVTGRDLGPSDIACPACGGVLRRLDEGGVEHFRCRVGHQYSPESLIASQDDALENAMWAALRGLEEQAATAQRVAENFRGRDLARAAERFEERERTAVARADVIRAVLRDVTRYEPVDAENRPEPEDGPARTAGGSSNDDELANVARATDAGNGRGTGSRRGIRNGSAAAQPSGERASVDATPAGSASRGPDSRSMRSRGARSGASRRTSS